MGRRAVSAKFQVLKKGAGYGLGEVTAVDLQAKEHGACPKTDYRCG